MDDRPGAANDVGWVSGASPSFLRARWDTPVGYPSLRYYSFEWYSRQKVEEKLAYMHLNPVRAGLVERPEDWRWSLARWYLQGRTAGVPLNWVEC